MSTMDAHSGKDCLESVQSIFTNYAALDEQMKVILFHKISQKAPALAAEILADIVSAVQESESCEWQEQSHYMDGLLHGIELLEKGLSCGKK